MQVRDRNHAILTLVKSNPNPDDAFVEEFRDQASDILSRVQGAFRVTETDGAKKHEALTELRALDSALRTMMLQNGRLTEANRSAADAHVTALNARTTPGLEGETRKELQDATVTGFDNGFHYQPKGGSEIKRGYVTSSPETAKLAAPKTQPMTGILAFAKNVSQLITLCTSLAPAGPIGLTAANFAQADGSSTIDGHSSGSFGGYQAGLFSFGSISGSSHGEIHGQSQFTQHSPDFAINTMVQDLQQRLEAAQLIVPHGSTPTASHNEEYHRTNHSALHPFGGDRVVRFQVYSYKTKTKPVSRDLEPLPNQPAYVHIPGDAWQPYETIFTSQAGSVPDIQLS